jgi:hypothetical protein
MNNYARHIAQLFPVLALAGCDAFYQQAQIADLRVTDVKTLSPIKNADVSVVNDHTADAANTPKSRLTDENGLVRLAFDTSYIRGGLNGLLLDPPSKDRLTGSSREVKVGVGSVSENISVQMKRGLRSGGQNFAVIVESIARPIRAIPATQKSE